MGDEGRIVGQEDQLVRCRGALAEMDVEMPEEGIEGAREVRKPPSRGQVAVPTERRMVEDPGHFTVAVGSHCSRGRPE